MRQLYPGVCGENFVFSHAHFLGTCYILAWADTQLVTHRAFLGPKEADEQEWKPTFFVLWLT